MKILHTSDWHLGKYLENASRIEEQKKFISQLNAIVQEENIDMILITGDIYDTYNPSSESERLFFSALKELSDNGKRLIIIIAGNHDNPERLIASSPIALEQGILLIGYPKTTLPVCNYENFSIIETGEGIFTIEFRGEKISFLALAYPSEKRLDEVIVSNNEADLQKDFSDKIKYFIDERTHIFKEDTINIMLGHFFINGGLESKSERDIKVGGAYGISVDSLPVNAQYIAMGHLHRPQQIKKGSNIYYSGSPIQYSVSEINYAKSVNIISIKAGEDAHVEKYYLKNYKPIEVWDADSIEEAITLCESRKDEDSWVYLNIKTDRVLLPSEISKIRQLKKDILVINPMLSEGDSVITTNQSFVDKTLKENFIDFYKFNNNGTQPPKELIDIFIEISSQ